jgi:hypothetical protein
LPVIFSFLEKSLPYYQIDEDGIVINLMIKDLMQINNENRTIKIFFKELTEIKELSFWEADALFSYNIGPDLSLYSASIKDLLDYTHNKIDRPRYYALRLFSKNTLLLKGNSIYYVLPVSNKDNKDLIYAFNKATSSSTS